MLNEPRCERARHATSLAFFAGSRPTHSRWRTSCSARHPTRTTLHTHPPRPAAAAAAASAAAVHPPPVSTSLSPFRPARSHPRRSGDAAHGEQRSRMRPAHAQRRLRAAARVCAHSRGRARDVTWLVYLPLLLSHIIPTPTHPCAQVMWPVYLQPRIIEMRAHRSS